MNQLIISILQQCFNLALPFGFSFGIFCVTVWSAPMIVRMIKSIF